MRPAALDPLLRDHLRSEAVQVERSVARVRLVGAALFAGITVAQLAVTGRSSLLVAMLPFILAALAYAAAADVASRRSQSQMLPFITTALDSLTIAGICLIVSLAAGRPDFTTKTPTTALFFAQLVLVGMRQSQALALFATIVSAILYLGLLVPPVLMIPESITLAGVGLDDLSSTRVGVGRVLIVEAFLVTTGILIIAAIGRTRRLVGRALDTRTFLFADLRGYTAYVEAHGDAAAAVLVTTYRTIVRSEIARTGGTEISTEGDSFFVIFDSARQGMSCGIGIQRAVAAGNAGELQGRLQVGIGIHAGEPEPHDGQFLGSAVNIAARLAQVSAAGELLVTDVITGLLRTAGLPPGAGAERHAQGHHAATADPVRGLGLETA